MDAALPALARPFGARAADLEIDFAHPDRPALVTALLAACVPPHDGEHWWERSVGARHRALLAMLHALDAAPPAQMGTCGACGERLEFELPVGDLAAWAVDETPVDIAGVQRPLRVRRPNGRDLKAWQAHAPTPPSTTDVLRGLVIDGELRDEDVPRVAQALEQADPLVAFGVQVACPACGQDAEYEVDLEGLALTALAARQRALLHDVHRLASCYGWSEAQVLAVPPWRRAHYLAWIEAAS
jgi:hypothetical protein